MRSRELTTTMLNRLRSIVPLTARQRIVIYLVLAALAGLACVGVDYTIDANRFDVNVPGVSDLDCSSKTLTFGCSGPFTFSNGTCHLKACKRPPANPPKPVTNCPFGKTNRGSAWTPADCAQRAKVAGCTQGALYSFGCYGYTCTDLRCAQ